MKKKEKMSVCARRMLAALFAAALILETVPLQPKAMTFAERGKSAADTSGRTAEEEKRKPLSAKESAADAFGTGENAETEKSGSEPASGPGSRAEPGESDRAAVSGTEESMEYEQSSSAAQNRSSGTASDRIPNEEGAEKDPDASGNELSLPSAAGGTDTGNTEEQEYTRDRTDGTEPERAEDTADGTEPERAEDTADGTEPERAEDTADGKSSLRLPDVSGEISARVKDLLGNAAYESAGPLVFEEDAPVIEVEISVPDQEVIYTCTSVQSPEERPEQISDYHRTLNVRVSVSEKPEKESERGYSGIREVLWALVPAEADAKSAKENRTGLVRNAAPSDIKELYQNDRYGNCVSVISPGQIVEKLEGKKNGHEGSGPCALYIWAVDFCGNGENSPLVIPLLLDAAAPEVTVQMENGREYEGKYYYRADNNEDASDDRETAAITIRAKEDRQEGTVGSLTAVLKGSVTGEELSRESAGSDREQVVFTVKDLQNHFGSTEQEITITVSSSDDLGNTTTFITEDGTRGVRLKRDKEGRASAAALIRDAKAPVVTVTYASAEGADLHLYRTEDSGAGRGTDASALTAYTGGAVKAAFEVDDAFAGNGGLFRDISGVSGPGEDLKCDGVTTEVLDVGEGEDRTFVCSVYGTDIAGNPAVVREGFADGTRIEVYPEDMAVRDFYEQTGCGRKGDHIPAYNLVIDRKAPEITVTYEMDMEKNPEQTAFLYDDRQEAGNVLTAYISGVLKVKASVDEDGEHIDFGRLYYKNPGEEAAVWNRAAIGRVRSGQDGQKSWIELAPAKSDGQYLYCVYGTDRAGNRANVTEQFAGGMNLEEMFADDRDVCGKRKGADVHSVPYYAIVIDTRSPAVTGIVTKDPDGSEDGAGREGNESGPSFYEDTGAFYYNKDGTRTVMKIDEANFDSQRITTEWKLDGRVEKRTGDVKDRKVTFTFRREGVYENISVCGTDRAGNHLVIREETADSEKDGKISQNAAVQRRAAAGEGRDRFGLADTYVELTYARILDLRSPVAVITHTVPDNSTGYLYPESENGGTAVLYCKNALTTKIRITDTLGEGGKAAAIPLDAGKLEVKKLFRRAGGSFTASAVGRRGAQTESAASLTAYVETNAEGHYAFTVKGTDRAGNPVIVREALCADSDRKAVVDKAKGNYNAGEPEEKGLKERETYHSFYVLVHDRTAPVYRFTINNPSGLEETFDEKTGIAYYGRSVSSIRAKYVVTDCNFDDTRILAGITSKAASDGSRTEDLYPAWTAPAVKGRTFEKKGRTTAVFSLRVDVDSRNEGVHRFEIEGCDKAGNFLVPGPGQEKADHLKERAFLAARTMAQDAAKGRFWTQRKAVDVTAPAGVLKVRSRKGGSDNYYEMKFGAGGNDPVKYEPFRRETSAFVTIESDDCSPTAVSCSLRSLDSGKDAAYQQDNPVTGAKNGIWSNDNSVEVTVRGEQVFYIENILIKDRAGNVRAGDGESSYALAKSSNVYLDVTSPSVSGIMDDESPKVRIVADGSFTRHEADGERYIYRPDGSALDLKVSVSDPGGRARSSGLGKVAVEIRVGDTVVTDKVILDGIPYSYEKGGGTGCNPLKYKISDAKISIPAGSFAESNDITITVRAWDNSGNGSLPSRDGGLVKLGIDTTAPEVEVNYRDTVEPRHDRYFRAGRTVEVVVVDRNVDGKKITIDTNTDIPGSFSPPHGNRAADGSGESGNGDRWIKTLHYHEDGDYTLQIDGTDALGNRISDIRWNGPAPNAFTVDTTSPRIRILLPEQVNEQDGVKYYGSAVTAKIEILEHNFFEETDGGLPDISIAASNHSGAEAPDDPGRSAFVSHGPDLYVSAAECAADGDYEITVSYTDPAGNEAVAAGGEGEEEGSSGGKVRSGRFTVDTLAPELRLDPKTFNVDSSTGKPLEGAQNQIYTERDFAPRVIIREINYDAAGSDFAVRVYGANVRSDEMIQKDGDESRGEYSIRFRNFAMDRDVDGVYKVTVSAADLAGHEMTLDFMFSVNRFGSTYVYADDLTEEKMKSYYINDTEEPLRILELTPVELGTHTVELFKDHKRSTLIQGEQYTFGAPGGSAGTGEDSEGHRVYEYVISPEVYEEEGVYDFVLSSRDAAGNENTTALFRNGQVQGVEIVRTKFPIEFQVDKTVPVNRITGVENGRERFSADRLDLTLYPEDSQSDIREVEVKISEGSGSSGAGNSGGGEKYMHYRLIGEKEDAHRLAQEHVYPIEEAGKGIRITLEEKDSWQFMEVITTDLAGNRSTDYRKGDPEAGLIETRRRFLVTTNPLVRFCSGRYVFYGLAAAVFLLSVLFFLRKGNKRAAEG